MISRCLPDSNSARKKAELLMREDPLKQSEAEEGRRSVAFGESEWQNVKRYGSLLGWVLIKKVRMMEKDETWEETSCGTTLFAV